MIVLVKDQGKKTWNEGNKLVEREKNIMIQWT